MTSTSRCGGRRGWRRVNLLIRRPSALAQRLPQRADMLPVLATLLVLGAEPVAVAEPPPTPERHHAVFAQPLATVLGAAVLHGISASGGVIIRANDEWSFVGDFAVLLFGSGGQGEDLRGVTSATISLGYSARLRGSGLSGFFITPKVYGVVGDNWTDRGVSPLLGTDGFSRWAWGELGVGVDLSLQWVHGPLYLATVFGVGTGFAFGTTVPVSTFTGPIFASTAPGWSPTVALNVHLFRIGYAF